MYLLTQKINETSKFSFCKKTMLTTLMACFLAGNVAITQESSPKGAWYFGM